MTKKEKINKYEKILEEFGPLSIEREVIKSKSMSLEDHLKCLPEEYWKEEINEKGKKIKVYRYGGDEEQTKKYLKNLEDNDLIEKKDKELKNRITVDSLNHPDIDEDTLDKIPEMLCECAKKSLNESNEDVDVN